MSHGLCWFPDSLVSRLHLNCNLTAQCSSPAPTTSIRAQLLASHYHCVYSNATTRLLPQRCPFESERSSPTSTRARTLTSLLYRVQSSAVARLRHPSSRIEPERSHSTSTMSIRAQSLISHLHPLKSSPNAHFPPYRVRSRTIARLPLPTCRFEPERSLPASTVSNRAQSLISHLRRLKTLASHPHHVNSSRNARLLPPPCQFGPNRSSTTPTGSIRAQSLVSHLHHVLSSSIARVPPPPCQFEPYRSSPASTASL